MSKYLYLVSVLFLCVGFGFGAEEVPFCECVNATVNCADGATLDGLVQTLLDLSDVCLNECSGACQKPFYKLHAYHELCTAFGDNAGELYHDLALSCPVCDVSHIGSPIDRPQCPQVDCSDFADQQQLITKLTSVDCQTKCETDPDCVAAWTKLSFYHETCPEENLSVELTKEYHDIEESCPPECAPPVTGVPKDFSC